MDLEADSGADSGADSFSTVSLVYTGHMTNGGDQEQIQEGIWEQIQEQIPCLF